MLTCLYVENIAIIKRISIDFTEGFTILTGETGAGKSILIDSIGLLLGNKARKELIGAFGEQAFVKAQFTDLPPQALKLLREYDINVGDDGVFIERKIGKDGRSTAKINMVQVPISFLQTLAPNLINIHGQHDNIQLLNTGLHIEFLDKYADLDDLISDYKIQYDRLREIRRHLQDLTLQAERRDEQLSRLSFKLQEYERVNPCVGMLAFLTDKRKLLQSQKAVMDFLGCLKYGDDIDIARILTDALAKAEKLMAIDNRFKEIYVELEQMQELASSVIIQGEDIASEFELGDSLPEIEDKIYELQQLLSRYGPTEEDLLLDWEHTQREFERTGAIDDLVDECKEQFVDQLSLVQKTAQKISEKRKKAAVILGQKVKAELAFLDMNGVEFVVDVQTKQNEKGGYKYNDRGIDHVEFLISTNAGQGLKPLSKIASGGELSRIMLSLTNALIKQQQVDTLIFDEVDTGVSGKTAEKIGVKLQEVSKERQVLCITHLAQIAALGNRHYKISKNTSAALTETNVTLLDRDARIAEVARIIGGIDITDTVRSLASEMIGNQ